jgi:lysophospholipase L1-like esterase
MRAINAKYFIFVVVGIIFFSVFNHVMEEKQLEELHNSTLTVALTGQGRQEITDELKLKEEELAQMKNTHVQDEVKIEELTKQLEVSKKQLDAKDETTKEVIEEENTTALEPKSSVFEPHEVCSYFPSQPFTATRLWQKYLPRIMDASKNPLIPELLTDEEDAKMHTLLEETLPPSRMRRAAMHMPTFSHSIVKNVVEIVQKRIQDPENNPPLRVAVFGGSVTIGRGCHGKGMSNLKCAWPQRLELLLNQFAKMDIVKIYNLGVGGTSSIVGTNMVKYWMYPDDLSKVGPDVIINSYSTNDSLPPWDIAPEADYVTIVMDQVRRSLQAFVRAALQSKQCTVQPLVVHVDDYLGPQQPWLLGELSYSTAMTQLARWYDTVGISYGEVVRDIVYQDKSDGTFFNENDVHYGHWAHQTIAWSVGFASLELLSNYCDDEHYARMAHNNAMTNGTATPVADADADGPDSLKDTMKKKKLFLPPPLTREMVLQNATKEFTAALDVAHQSFVDMNCTSTANNTDEKDLNPCIVSWISSPGGYGKDGINWFMTRMYGVSRKGWATENNIAEGWGNKVGWVATEANATFSLKFDKIAKNVKSVTIYFIRSYGEKWKDSRAKFTISRVKKIASATDGGDINGDGEVAIVSEEEISGVHANANYTYSLTLSQTIVLSEPILKGDTINIKVDLVSGSHFKIMGMMICNQ